MELPILYEDTDIVVIDKPSGLVVNRAETVKEETIQDWMINKLHIPSTTYQTLSNNQILNNEDYFLQRAGIVHRLDRETSGVMILAKTVAAFTEMLRQFKDRDVKKEYIALTHGKWKDKHGEITATVGRMRHDRKMFGVREDGRESVTGFRVEHEYPVWNFPKELKVDDRGYTGFSLVRFMPRTGRTHQIRVHARHMGHPIAGDFVYAGRKRSREDRKWAGRILLQAQRIEFHHPVTRHLMTFESSNADITTVIAYFG